MGKQTPSSVNHISLGLLESHHHVRSYFEATGQAGRTIKWSELATIAEGNGLRIIYHQEGSLQWQSRPLGGDSGNPTVRVRNAGMDWNSPCSRLLTANICADCTKITGLQVPSDSCIKQSGGYFCLDELACKDRLAAPLPKRRRI